MQNRPFTIAADQLRGTNRRSAWDSDRGAWVGSRRALSVSHFERQSSGAIHDLVQPLIKADGLQCERTATLAAQHIDEKRSPAERGYRPDREFGGCNNRPREQIGED